MTYTLIGSCALCGQQLILTPDDCWHPYDTPVACPSEPDRDNWDRDDPDSWPAFYAAGKRPNRPGRENWTPTQPRLFGYTGVVPVSEWLGANRGDA